MLVFDLENIYYEYRQGERALNGVSFKVAAGEKVVLLGPNGCGKSTLQKILAGLVSPCSGRFVAFEQEVTNASLRDKEFTTAYRRKVGLVFQNADVQTFCASVMDEVMFGPLSMGIDYLVALEQAKQLLDFVGIANLANRMPHHLSGGEKKKVAIAAVLSVNPSVLILDEPTNGLDPRTQRWMIETLKVLNKRGKTIITATHQLDIVPEIADRVIIMGEERKILADGKTDSLLADRALLLTANLVDERQHIHLHGHDSYVHLHKHVDRKQGGATE